MDVSHTSTPSPWEPWRQQLEEAGEIVTHRLRTCAFCGVESSFANPVRLCPACRVPTCWRCPLSISVRGDEGSDVETFCRHPSRKKGG